MWCNHIGPPKGHCYLLLYLALGFKGENHVVQIYILTNDTYLQVLKSKKLIFIYSEFRPFLASNREFNTNKTFLYFMQENYRQLQIIFRLINLDRKIKSGGARDK